MKKFYLILVTVIILISLNSCSNKEIILNFDDITENTILVKDEGVVQAAIVEEFDKDYYNLSELTEFVKKEVDAYNEDVGDKMVIIDDVVLKKGNAIVMLTYLGMAHYSGFNNVQAAYFRADIEEIPLQLPEQVVNIKDDELVSLDSVLGGKEQVLILYEPYEILVEGKIRYHSENANLEDSNRAQSSTNDPTVIIYTP